MIASTVIGVFDRFLLAEDAIQELGRAGFARNDISIVAGNQAGDHATKTADAGADMVVGAGAGAAIGGVAGLIVGLVALAIPGVGPILAAGPIAAALGILGIGAAAGGFIGALTGMNIPEEEAGYYTEAVRKGGTVVIVKTDNATAQVALDVLKRSGAQDVKERHEAEQPDGVPRSSEPSAPQVSPSGGRVYEYGSETDPRQSRYEDFEADYRSNFNQRFTGGGYTYEHFSPAYRYGYELAQDEALRGQEWPIVEPEARREWDERNPNTWEQVSEAVRHAWERARA